MQESYLVPLEKYGSSCSAVGECPSLEIDISYTDGAITCVSGFMPSPNGGFTPGALELELDFAFKTDDGELDETFREVLIASYTLEFTHSLALSELSGSYEPTTMADTITINADFSGSTTWGTIVEVAGNLSTTARSWDNR